MYMEVLETKITQDGQKGRKHRMGRVLKTPVQMTLLELLINKTPE